VSAENSPRISVAIITYNQRAYLQQAIESVIAQDYLNLEIVIADDASTDDTHELLRQFDERHSGKFSVLTLTKAMHASSSFCTFPILRSTFQPGRLIDDAVQEIYLNFVQLNAPGLQTFGDERPFCEYTRILGKCS
jgi:glycosyltransferase involved in cell wall biosynthesis